VVSAPSDLASHTDWVPHFAHNDAAAHGITGPRRPHYGLMRRHARDRPPGAGGATARLKHIKIKNRSSQSVSRLAS
jgi:hypothetical protein